MIITGYYSLQEASLSVPYTIEDLKHWQKKVLAFLFARIGQSPCSLFTMYPYAQSIAYGMGSHKEGKFNSKKYLVSYLESFEYDDLRTLIETDKLYLGHTVLVAGHMTPQEIEALIVSWQNEIIRSGVEFFKMDCDGNCLCWYNSRLTEKSGTLFEW